jgi:hypothetical protein
MQRQGNDIGRLIEEKRELEDLVEQQNQSIKQIRQHQNSSICSITGALGTKENLNMLNKQDYPFGGEVMMSKILGEKDNYIFKLEGECFEMKREIE